MEAKAFKKTHIYLKNVYLHEGAYLAQHIQTEKHWPLII